MKKYHKQKHCKKCGKLLPQHNQTGYCRRCYLPLKRKEIRQKHRKEGKCALCGGEVKPKIIYPYRCEKCEETDKRAQKKFKEKKKITNG